ncbi:penicillin-binding transpeptidase domain-containing protein [Deinococcus multiflagellatus]|uniref:Penicillin-binding transpeptidase domain-containing protein n=1 Tax=Deinococcus multiflagellatus TaxID=1656887 RepID=A0ABW1ZSM2_9DEIO
MPHPGRLNTQQILRYSSNVGMTRLVEAFPPSEMHAYLQAYGFGRAAPVGVSTGRGQVRPPEQWDDVIRATNAFGQGMTVTTLQLAAAFNVLANDGVYVAPSLLAGTPIRRRPVLRPEIARTTRAMLHAVIDDGISKQAGIPGYHLSGKTGTAQVAENGRYSERIFTSTFAGLVLTEPPRYTVAVMVRGAKRNYQGSQLAAPIFREIAGGLISKDGLMPQPPHPAASTPPTGNCSGRRPTC